MRRDRRRGARCRRAPLHLAAAGVAHRADLAADPVLAVRAVEIAPEHAEGHDVRPREHVEKWFLLDGVAGHAVNVSERHTKLAILVEADFADPSLAPRQSDSSVRRSSNGGGCGRAFRIARPPLRQPADRALPSGSAWQRRRLKQKRYCLRSTFAELVV